jgi:cellulose synthase/poly-beta-1,6-N-acetylglucosamine synthase-like glycosyltransferase
MITAAEWLQIALLLVYFVALALLVVYGLHRYQLTWLYRKHKRDAPPAGILPPDLPVVTVQLPLFNERYVAPRLLEAIRRLDYPRDRLEVQVLDDSTDDTARVLEPVIARMCTEGFDIHHLRRTDRRGYKAGALAAGLTQARGEFIAIFDADFVPEPDFLRRLMPYFTEPKIGMVQARWGHLNDDYSLLTKLQSIYLDAHFIIEHLARNRSGRFFNFNGTAGMWRRSCLVSAGGWQSDTLTEDLDISYRAQLRGWKFVFVPDVIAPSELPAEMTSFRQQQHRWAKGSVQVARKLLREILASRQPWKVKVEAWFHLTNNFAFLLMAFFSLALLPSMLLRRQLGWETSAWLELAIFVLATPSAVLFYMTSQRATKRRGWRSLMYVPLLMALGTGLALNNSRAVLEALFGRCVEFKRTPKHGMEGRVGTWTDKIYTGRLDLVVLGEITMVVYFAVAVHFALTRGLYLAVPFLLIFLSGFLFVSLMSLWQTGERHWRSRNAPSARHAAATGNP